MLQGVAGCCHRFQCVAVCCSVLHCAAVYCSVLQHVTRTRWRIGHGSLGVLRCIVLQRVAVCCSVLQCTVVCCSVLHLLDEVGSGTDLKSSLTG